MLLYLLVFPFGDPAVDLRKLCCPPAGNILRHQAHEHAFRQIVFDPVENLDRIARMAWKDQMPHNRPAQEHSISVKNGRAGLPRHFQDGLRRTLRIIDRPGEALRQCRVAVLIVRQIDRDQPIQHPQSLHPLITTGIIHHGHGKRAKPQGLCDSNSKMCWVDQIDVVRPLVYQVKKYVGKFLRG